MRPDLVGGLDGLDGLAVAKGAAAKAAPWFCGI